MKEVYFIYAAIPYDIYNNGLKNILPTTSDFRYKNSKNEYRGLYAWTKNKDYVKEFFDIRNKDIYSLVTNDQLSDDEYQELKSKYGDLQLKPRVYFTDKKESIDKSISIISTKNEYLCSTVFGEENINERIEEMIRREIPSKIFSEEVQKALSFIGYSDIYVSLYGNENDLDAMYYNESYGLNSDGSKKVVAKPTNCVNILLFLFHFMFYGTERG